MKILVIGSGGREHALVWKLRESKSIDHIYCIPGNGGIRRSAETADIQLHNFVRLSDFVKEKKIDFTVVGPELPMVTGITDHFKTRGLRIFGPNLQCARLEGSKIFAKNFMKKYDIPTAEFETFDSYEKAAGYIGLQKNSLVIKADGLCAGKGVIVCDTPQEARNAAEEILVKKAFGNAGTKIIVEKRLTGQEVSIIGFCDGNTILPLPPAQDHKRIFDGDKGPNTGGMGAYSPVPIVTKEIMEKIRRRIFHNFIKGLHAEKMDYCGMIYFGILLVGNVDPYILEFNVRFGDPETQPLLPLINNDIIELMSATVTKRLADTSISIKDECSVCIVLASGGYPGSYEKNKEITGLDNVKDALVFHSGTRYENEKFYTDGGRVLGVTALGKTLEEARKTAYNAVEQLHFDGMQYRKDIGMKAL